jgi:hypothetical protein
VSPLQQMATPYELRLHPLRMHTLQNKLCTITKIIKCTRITHLGLRRGRALNWFNINHIIDIMVPSFTSIIEPRSVPDTMQ